MRLPLVAVVGRPNVGKSTFVNRIIQAEDAIVHEMRGVTRDRSYHEAEWNGRHFMLVDTGGIEMNNDDAFQGSIRGQAFAATEEAEVIVFLVDGKTGINADDEEVARILRKSDKPVFLAVNKMDSPGRTDELWEFYQLGLGDPWPVSSIHGHGTGICSTRSWGPSTPSTFPRTTARRSRPSTSPSSAAPTRAKAR